MYCIVDVVRFNLKSLQLVIAPKLMIIAIIYMFLEQRNLLSDRENIWLTILARVYLDFIIKIKNFENIQKKKKYIYIYIYIIHIYSV
jgi:hypothetical protein